MRFLKRAAAAAISAAVLCSGFALGTSYAQTAEMTSDPYEWGALKIGGGGFVSGIIAGQKNMFARTDVGGAYRYDYEKREWVQVMDFINEADKGYLSIDALCIDPTDDNNVYMLAGCAYFSDERTAVFKSTDGGYTFKEIEVTDLIKVHGNGYGRQCGESIAVDPDNPDILYCGGDTDGLIMSKDAGETWEFVESFDKLGLFTNEVKWPTWKEITEKTTVGTDYVSVNGISTIAIQNGKVYVGVSDNTIGANVYVADVGKDNWAPLSKDLPTDSFPSRINKDADGNLLISYVGGLMFNGTGGGIYKYDVKSGKVTDISPTGNSFGGCVSDPKDSKKLVATTCGVWSSQLWTEDAWETDTVCWGDQFFRSVDGGATWESITPGNAKSWGGPLQADYLKDSGYSWIRDKAIHWCGTVTLDPRDSNRIMLVSGNGVFSCDNVWDELPVYYFHPDGIEEVVCLDFISVPGGDEFSAIGDYDGFRHTSVYESGEQHYPNMGSTCAIAYCPQNPDVMVRISMNQAGGYYTLDGGKKWTKMANMTGGGKAAITELSEGKYRIFKSNADDGGVSYSDDLGTTWKACTGIPSAYGSKSTYMLVEPNKPNMVYAYATYYNSSWFYSKDAPDMSDAKYVLCVSDDYGATFKATDVCMYDQCDSAARIAQLGEDDLILGAGWHGMYRVTESGTKLEKLDVFYCKTVGYGAPKKAGDVNVLYMYGKPAEEDAEGIYRSEDAGKSWVLINSEHLYGGTGNGNFIVGDMNEYGTMYMSTVGCGIVYGKISDGTEKPTQKPTEKPTEKPTQKPTDKPATDAVYGDADCSGAVDILDVILLNRNLLGVSDLTEQGRINADVDLDGKPGTADSLGILKFVVKVITTLPLK